MTLMVSAIAVISLIVGGVGVMNIMLVSVVERTREIGIRMAVGARQSDILQQFLIEAVMVSLLGGIFGVGLSLGIGALFSLLVDSIKMQFSLFSILMAFGCSSLIGILFGYLPARNAARLDPVVALARE
ncbi:FtsX-like permease family protein, partial [Aeromonas sp. HMWF015]